MRILDEKLGPAKPPKHFTPPPPEEFRGPLSFVEGQLLLGFALLLVFFVIVMAAEGLHYLTGGKVPELIDWQPRKPHIHGKP